MKIGNRDFLVGKHTYIMGILNVTPDSFSDGGLFVEKDAILKRVDEMIREGCDIIDVGGESTRPGHEKISDEAEINRITPVIELIKNYFDIPISLDTYKAKVAKAGIDAGIAMINDIWGLKHDPEMKALIAEAKIPCCLMHNRHAEEKSNHDLLYQQENKREHRPERSCEHLFSSGTVTIDRRSRVIVDYNKELHQQENLYNAIKTDLAESLKLAQQAGILKDNIILDPGIGFGKTYEENLYALKYLAELKTLGYPCLLGASRKSVIGLTLNLPVTERLEGTIITTVMAVMSGYAFVRVHDIEANRRSIKMTEAILNRS
ncbi:MAG: dihydropteroate synthase [Lachnospiraceae bacterium]|nr:dihydropteroate synthase [Lachnospiraceae bacterium]